MTTYYPDNPQIGTASADSTDTYATGVEAFLKHYPTPQSIPDIDNTALAWWVGVDLADGTFLQAGLITGSGWGCDSNYGVFVVMELTTLTGTADLADQMGPAGAYPATLTQHGYGNPSDTLAAAAYVNHTTDCPPSTVAGEDQGYNPGYPNRAGVGSQAYFGYPCVSNGTPLWP